jgi:iron complex transport system substrate-binding protein
MRSWVLTGIAFAQLAHAQVSVRDDYGNAVTLARPAARVVSLAPHLTEAAFAAGGGDRLVGAVEFSDFPPEAARLPRVGNEAGIRVEAVIALRPDLVIAWPNAGSRPQIDRIAAFGIPVYRSEPRSLEDVARTLEAIGALLGTSAAAREAARTFRRRVAELERAHAAKPPVRVFYQVWDRPLLTVSGAHLISKVMRLCGGVNVFADVPGIAPAVEREAVLAADPEAIVASGADESPPPWLDEWRRFPRLAAVARGNLFAIPPQLLQRHTPRILEGAAQLCALLDEVRRRSGR